MTEERALLAVSAQIDDWRTQPAPGWDAPMVAEHRLDGARYTSTAFFSAEWEQMWTKVWLLLGRENAIPTPGDYAVEEVGPESFLLVRQPDAGVRAFYNVCQHRGSRLTAASDGSVRGFVCPYHSWTYALDGTLTAAPDAEDFDQGNPCDHVRLSEVRCETFAGFVWVNMDPDAATLRDFLGPLVDDWASYGCDDWRRVTAVTAQVPCNWKVIQDNFCESYHLPTVHPQLRESHEESYRETRFDMCGEGHNRMIMKGATPSRTQLGDEALLPHGLRHRLELWDLDPDEFAERPYDVRVAIQTAMRQFGPGRGHTHYDALRDEQLTDSHHYNVFPNCSLTFGADGVLLQRMRPHATDPEQCVFDHWYYASAPAIDDGVVAAATNVRVDGTEADHVVLDYGEQPMGIIPDQDIAAAIGQQAGLRSRGYRGAYLSGQETRVRHLHQVIDEYIAGARPTPH